MPFQRPELKTIIERMTSDAKSRIPIPQIRKSNANVLSRTLAGAIHGVYGYVDYLAKQLFIDTAETEYLDRWAAIWDVRRKLAVKAAGTVQFTFSGEYVNVPVGTVLSCDDNVYETTGAPDAQTGVTAVTALIAGAESNLIDGEEMMLVSPVIGVESTVLCKGIGGGIDAEDDDSLRSRLLSRMQAPPNGGSKQDYVDWTLSVAGATRAWCYPEENGAGTVVVRFVCDNMESIVPTDEMIEKVYSYLDEVRPVTAAVSVLAPTLKPVNVTIAGLLTDSTAVRDAVIAELNDVFSREAEPGALVYLSHIRAAVSAAVGEIDHEIISPSTNPTAGAGELLVLGSVTWQ